MTENETSSKKSAVQELNFGAKTARRVAWESWEFSIVGPYQAEVTNASYGYLKDEHAYVVGVREQEGVAIPVECECPADLYDEEFDCKHKVALASIGGAIVLEAAVEYESDAVTVCEAAPTGADKLRADGCGDERGSSTDGAAVDSSGGCDCTILSGDLPCWDCYRTKARTESGRV